MDKPTKKTWKEFQIFVQQHDAPSEEDSMLENLGIAKSDKTADPEYTIARVAFPLEDVCDYFESYNSIRKRHGVCVNLYTGLSYFILIPYDKFVKMRRELGIEEDPQPADKAPKQEIKVEESF